MVKPIIHLKTAKQLSMAVAKPHHAYMFLGQDGLGKTTVASHFAAQLLGVTAEAGDLKRWVYMLSPQEGKKISVAQVKEMAKFANQSKSAKVRKKAVIIDEADNISIEAANSLLSMLEEAPADTVFILVSNNSNNLPDTVISRLHTVHFYEPTSQQLDEFIKSNDIDSDSVGLVGRRPARLLDTDLLARQKLLADQAKGFIRGDLAARLVVGVALTSKAQVQNFLNSLANRLLVAPAEFNPNRGESLLLAQSHLYNNGNPKFVLECLALEFE